MALVLLAVGFKIGWTDLKNGEIFPISVVKVEANYDHLSQEELQKIISTGLPASFWTIDLRTLQSRLKALAWVQSVQIEKAWPETLTVRVNEKKVFARWGEKGLLSNKDQIFYPNKISQIDARLPILYGPVEQKQKIIAEYGVMANMLAREKLTIETLLLSESGAWVIRLRNGTLLLLGKDDPIKRLNRFLKAYQSVFLTEDGQTKMARRVDLRYPHGLAVSWVVEPIKE